MGSPLTEVLAERDALLRALDIAGAIAFITKHGGYVPKQKIDWLRVLHLARFEVQTMPSDVRTESQIYLARTGAQRIATLPTASPYARAALDLVFPKDDFDAWYGQLLAAKREGR